MSEVSIKALNERTSRVLDSQYKGIKFNPMVWIAFKKRKVKVDFKDGTLTFSSKANKVEKSNLFMIEGFLKSKGFKPKKDYIMEVKK